MAELSMIVRAGESPAVTYRFERFPVLVGRSEDCQLAICHQNVPRELFFAWLEDNGDTVRVEAVPALKTPLIANGTPLTGGISGKSLRVNAGEVEITLFCGKSTEAGIERNASKSRRHARGILLGLGLLCVLGVCALGHDDPDSSRALSETIPKTLQFPESSSAESGSHAAATLLQEADELLLRRTDSVNNRVRAVQLLEMAITELNSTDSNQAQTVQQRSRELKQSLMAEYLVARRTLFDALKKSRPDELATAAAQLLPWLEVMNADARGEIAAITRSKKKEKRR